VWKSNVDGVSGERVVCGVVGAVGLSRGLHACFSGDSFLPFSCALPMAMLRSGRARTRLRWTLLAAAASAACTSAPPALTTLDTLLVYRAVIGAASLALPRSTRYWKSLFANCSTAFFARSVDSGPSSI
jgi:hypothetical protein